MLSGVFPSKKVTVPVGVPEPGATADTLAVRVAFSPTMIESALTSSEVVVLAELTVCSSVVVLA